MAEQPRLLEEGGVTERERSEKGRERARAFSCSRALSSRSRLFEVNRAVLLARAARRALRVLDAVAAAVVAVAAAASAASAAAAAAA